MHGDTVLKESWMVFFPSTDDFPGEPSSDSDVEFSPSEEKKKNSTIV